jgi:Mg2+ and Co2+ transporter CorA
LIVRVYQDGRRRDEGAVPLQEAAARCGQGGFVWLGLFEPGEDLAQVRDTFGLHELAVEDAQNSQMRPKVELYDQDVRLVILCAARYDDAAEEVEFGVFVAPAFVITVRQGVASGLRGARQRLEQRPELLAAGSLSACGGRSWIRWWTITRPWWPGWNATLTRSRPPCSPARHFPCWGARRCHNRGGRHVV